MATHRAACSVDVIMIMIVIVIIIIVMLSIAVGYAFHRALTSIQQVLLYIYYIGPLARVQVVR